MCARATDLFHGACESQQLRVELAHILAHRLDVVALRVHRDEDGLHARHVGRLGCRVQSAGQLFSTGGENMAEDGMFNLS